MSRSLIAAPGRRGCFCRCPWLLPPRRSCPQIRVGVLSCNVAGGAGFVFGSSKQLDCTLEGRGRRERYYGVINKFGVDLGATTSSVISWAVLASTDSVGPGAWPAPTAASRARRASVSALGANALLGGSDRSIALQPLSVEHAGRPESRRRHCRDRAALAPLISAFSDTRSHRITSSRLIAADAT